ncbi:MAG: alpha-amylase family glycosyl hydrolase, partial [cyanobacterium endosymbiont of Rhopalodia fuxianensis]
MSSFQSKYPWWYGCVIYEIYIRSFYDSNGDGVGDLPGIIQKLDYLASLPIDALWITPFYQ